MSPLKNFIRICTQFFFAVSVLVLAGGIIGKLFGIRMGVKIGINYIGLPEELLGNIFIALVLFILGLIFLAIYHYEKIGPKKFAAGFIALAVVGYVVVQQFMIYVSGGKVFALVEKNNAEKLEKYFENAERNTTNDPSKQYAYITQETLRQLLALAVSQNADETIPVLVAAGADVNKKGGEFQTTPLMNAATFSNIDTIAALLDAGADPNLQDAVVGGIGGRTAAMFALG